MNKSHLRYGLSLRFLSVSLAATLLLGLVGCGTTDSANASTVSDASSVSAEVWSGNTTDTSMPADTNNETMADVAENNDDQIVEAPNNEALVEVDNNLFTTEVTVAAGLTGEDMTQEKCDEIVAEKGYKSGTMNEDGSVTFVMTKQQYKEYLAELRGSIQQSMDELCESEDCPHFESISVNDDLTEFTVMVSAEPDFTESFMCYGIMVWGILYNQVANNPDAVIVCNYINSETGEIIFSMDSTMGEEESGATFSDVPEDAYYYDAVEWAYDQGITVGNGDGTFSPDSDCTRAQAMVFLWRMTGRQTYPDSELSFTDVTDKESDTYKAILWAVERGITFGVNDNEFAPDDLVTRGQVMVFLWRYAGKPEASTTIAFDDVNDSSSMYKAIAWAVERGISSGISDTEFGADSVCTRAMLITFLYRYAKTS